MPKIALLSNITVGIIADILKKTCEVYYPAGFNMWQQEVLDLSSDFYRSQPEVVYILLYFDPYIEKQDEIEQFRMIIDSWLCTIKKISDQLPKIPIFVSSLDISNKICSTYSDCQFSKYVEAEWIDALEKLNQEGREIYILSVLEKIIDIGRNRFYSRKMWYLGNMPYSMTGIKAIIDLIYNSFSSIKGMRKKCIAVDLDNTLWGGVVGEDGVDGLILSDHKEGARYKDTQKLLLKMKNQGVLLVILSKNNIEDVYEVFEKHQHMVLKKEDFVKIVVNWEAKSLNIKRIATELNIGLDAFVFVDDNPAEREQMKAECPEVTVVEFPKDTAMLPEIFKDIYERYFKVLKTTIEDLNKTQMYHNKIKRAQIMQQVSSVEEYLSNLDIKVNIHFMKEEEEKRVTQLINKTNQFNTTTKRYSEEEIHQLGKNSNSSVVTAYMSDRFGDEGLISVMILLFSGDTVNIDSFLMSCRVMGRKLEYVMMMAVKQWIMENRKEIKYVSASYIKSKKNKPVENIYDVLGLKEVTENKRDEAIKSYKVEMKDLSYVDNYYYEVKLFENI